MNEIDFLLGKTIEKENPNYSVSTVKKTKQKKDEEINSTMKFLLSRFHKEIILTGSPMLLGLEPE